VIPLRDELPSRSFPLATVTLILVNIAAFLRQASVPAHLQGAFIDTYAAIPALISGQAGRADGFPPLLTILTSMFLHGGIIHLAGNMLFLWIFGDNVEDVMGRARFVLFYLLAGAAGAAVHVVIDPASVVPMVGASGAISGIMGAYIVLFPSARILTLVPLGFFSRVVHVPAMLFLGIWFLLQFLYAGASSGQRGGVAWLAHVGGFVAGLALVGIFRNRARLDWYRRFR
jgi:membrane associated rhomboid family serine protease